MDQQHHDDLDAIHLAHDDDLRAIQLAHDDEVTAIHLANDQLVEHLNRALASRDVIGQAKGITMVALHCTADRAFALLRAQSQAENRKLVVIAGEIAERVSRRATPN